LYAAAESATVLEAVPPTRLELLVRDGRNVILRHTLSMERHVKSGASFVNETEGMVSRKCRQFWKMPHAQIRLR
jgi:hypothetical protein